MQQDSISKLVIRAVNVNGLGDKTKRKSVLSKLGNKKTRLPHLNRYQIENRTHLKKYTTHQYYQTLTPI